MTGPIKPKSLRALVVAVLWLVLVLTLAQCAFAADERPASESQSQSDDSEVGAPSAPVVIDGRTLFRVRGTSSFSAERRAAGIAGRIKALAADRAISLDAVRAVEMEI